MSSHHHHHMRYNRVGSKKSSSGHGIIKGFRINSRRFSVQRLRTKFLYLLKIFNKLRFSYGNALQSMRKCLARSGGSSCKRDSRRNLVVMPSYNIYTTSSMELDHSRLRSFPRTNSFYSEAIADCLDFIKRNSLSMDENPVLNQR
ncbi:hypothetical protein ACH5RR_011982 [Cinchona calisaya]|uniref:Josephin-like protein n=1 Tax=Cinchona calisaya TaxID=153742 RepID=A0ABD3A6E1_9GENT